MNSSIQFWMANEIKLELDLQDVAQNTLARRAGLSEKHVSRLLLCRSQGTLECWDKLADALGMVWKVRLT